MMVLITKLEKCQNINNAEGLFFVWKESEEGLRKMYYITALMASNFFALRPS
jgi:hypothetical protein